MPDPTPPTEAERLREEFLREWFGPRQHRLGLSDIALDAILAAVRRDERERVLRWVWDDGGGIPMRHEWGAGEDADYRRFRAAALRAGEGA